MQPFLEQVGALMYRHCSKGMYRSSIATCKGRPILEERENFQLEHFLPNYSKTSLAWKRLSQKHKRFSSLAPGRTFKPNTYISKLSPLVLTLTYNATLAGSLVIFWVCETGSCWRWAGRLTWAEVTLAARWILVLTAALREIPENVSLMYLLHIVCFLHVWGSVWYFCVSLCFMFLCDEMKYCAADNI